MKASLLALAVALALLPRVRGDRAWAFVPASREAGGLGVLAVPDTPSEEMIRFVGNTRPAETRPGSPRRVVAVDLPEAVESEGVPAARPRQTLVIPGDALWPDAGGRIKMARLHEDHSRTTAGTPNPWEVRSRRIRIESDCVLTCSATIVGGGGGPVAIVNGRIVRRGDALDGFTVLGVGWEGVVLEHSGARIVVPRGRATTVALADN